MPSWAQQLANLYWQLRYQRNTNKKRTWYRRIRNEKKRLIESGVPYIEIHLWSRHLTNPRNPNAEARLHNWYAQGRLF